MASGARRGTTEETVSIFSASFVISFVSAHASTARSVSAIQARAAASASSAATPKPPAAAGNKTSAAAAPAPAGAPVRARRLSVGWADLGGLFDGLGAAAEKKGPVAIVEQSSEWWTTELGKRLAKTYNTLTIDRIHLRLAESRLVPLLMDLVFDQTPHVAEYAELAVKYLIDTKRWANAALNGEPPPPAHRL